MSHVVAVIGNRPGQVPSRANPKSISKYCASRPGRPAAAANSPIRVEFRASVARRSPRRRNPESNACQSSGQKHGYSGSVRRTPSLGTDYRDEAVRHGRFAAPPSARSVVWGVWKVKEGEAHQPGLPWRAPPATDCGNRGPPERRRDCRGFAAGGLVRARQRPGECSQLPFDGSARPRPEASECESTGFVEPRENSSMAARARASRERTVPTGIPRRPAISA